MHFIESAEKFARIRVQKIVHKQDKDDRLEEIKKKAENPKCLQLLIFDEAHYGATQQTKEGKQETPYSSILKHYNSQEYPNVIILLVTATPWNLLTVSSKLSDSMVMYDPTTGDLQSCDDSLAAIHTNRKTHSHQIPWNYGHEREIQEGKEIKLMVISVICFLFKTFLISTFLGMSQRSRKFLFYASSSF